MMEREPGPPGDGAGESHSSGAAVGAEVLPTRPRTRGECVDGPRPCPWVSCEHHLLHARLMRTASGIEAERADVTGRLVTSGREMSDDDCLAWLEASAHTCALDVADEGDATLLEVGEFFGVTRERIRQIEAAAKKDALTRAGRSSLATYLEADLDARDPDGDVGRPRSRGKHTMARPVEESRRALTPPPATWTGPTHPDGVRAAGDTFWCAPLGFAMPVTLCCARQVATYDGNRNSTRVLQHPRYPSCAQCPEGNAMRVRLGVVPDAMPTRPNLRRLPLVDAAPAPTAARADLAAMPAPPRVAWFGDDADDAPALETEPTTEPLPDREPEVSAEAAPETAETSAAPAADPPPTAEEPTMHSDSDTESNDAKADGAPVEIASDARAADALPAAKCCVKGCERPVAGVRSDTHASLRKCCRECRHRGGRALGDGTARASTVVMWLGETYWRTGAGASMVRQLVSGATAPTPATASTAPTTVTAPAPTSTAAPTPVPTASPAPSDLVAELRDARRALVQARRVGGVDALEQIINELVALRG